MGFMGRLYALLVTQSTDEAQPNAFSRTTIYRRLISDFKLGRKLRRRRNGTTEYQRKLTNSIWADFSGDQ